LLSPLCPVAHLISHPLPINKRPPPLYYGNRRRQIICIAI